MLFPGISAAIIARGMLDHRLATRREARKRKPTLPRRWPAGLLDHPCDAFRPIAPMTCRSSMTGPSCSRTAAPSTCRTRAADAPGIGRHRNILVSRPMPSNQLCSGDIQQLFDPVSRIGGGCLRLRGLRALYQAQLIGISDGGSAKVPRALSRCHLLTSCSTAPAEQSRSPRAEQELADALQWPRRRDRRSAASATSRNTKVQVDRRLDHPL